MICPNCNSANIIKNGKTPKNEQRFKCKLCGKIFTIPSNDCSNYNSPQKQNSKQKSKTVALILLCFNFIGFAGLHRFYVGKIGTGLLHLFTLGLFGFGTIFDLILILTNSFTDSHGNILKKSTPQIKKISENLTAPTKKTFIKNPSTTPNVNKIEIPSEETHEDITTVVVSKPPNVFDKMYLKHYYDDVGIYTTYKTPSDIPVNKQVILKKDPENEHDPKAIKVLYGEIQLGFIYRGKLQDMCNNYLDRDDRYILSRTTQIDHNKHIYIYLAFYSKITEDMIVHTFSSTVSEEKYYEHDLYSYEGYEVDLSYDYEKEKFKFNDCINVPKSAHEFFESIQFDGEYTSYIENITENESGSYKIKINTFRN